jgi:Transcriptional regulators
MNQPKATDRESIFDQLRVEILDGSLPPGAPLKEVALAERFGVSRTPVRDGLNRLEQAGLVVRAKRGLVVKEIDPESVVQVYNLRILLEEEAAGQAAQSRTVKDLLRLEALLERDSKLVDKSDRSLIKSNMEFHEAVWKSTQNSILVDLLDRLTGHLVHAPQSTLSVGDRWEAALGEHGALVAAIVDRDVEKARGIARDHFEAALRIRMGLLRESMLVGEHE